MRKTMVVLIAIMALSIGLAACGGGGGGGDGDEDTYTISGQVTLNNVGYAGVAVALSGSADDDTTTDASGNYAFTDLSDGTYTVTATVADQTLTPTEYANIVVSGADVSGRDFALDTYSITGQVTLSGSGYPGATVNLSGAAVASTVTPASGNYTFEGLLNGAYIITPIVSGQTLSPASTEREVSGLNFTDVDFALNTWTISGQVTNSRGGMPGIQVDLDGAATGTVATVGTEGNYTFTGLLNGDYTLTPVSIPQTFSPADTSVSVSNGNRAAINFEVPDMIWVVDVNAAGTTENGYSWDTAFLHPQDGSDAAESGEQVWVAAGSYNAPLDTTDPTEPVLDMNEGVEYYGGFLGGETAVDERVPMVNETVLDGLDVAEQVVIAADNSLLSGFVVTAAYMDTLNTKMAPVNASDLSNFRIHDCVVTGNWTSESGQTGSSGLNISGGEVVNCVFSYNVGRNAPVYIIRGSSGGVDIVNSLFHDNDCEYAGGIVIAGTGEVRITNSTIADNISTNGSGIWMDNNANGTNSVPATPTWITNSIIWGEIEGLTGFEPPVISYSDVMGGYAGTGNIDGDPIFLDPDADDYRLDLASPCVDAGNNDEVPVSITTDLAGNSRIVDGDTSGEATVDMGAYESIPAP